MRHAIFGLALAPLLLALAPILPAAAEGTAQQPLPVSAEPDIDLPHPLLVECRPIYAATPESIGPASANPEQSTEGRLPIGTACGPVG